MAPLGRSSIVDDPDPTTLLTPTPNPNPHLIPITILPGPVAHRHGGI